MARLTMAQAYAYARQAGFDAADAVIAAAIAMAESGLNPAARGDVSLQTDYWGPSVGLMQVRTVKSETGKGTDRDITKLSDPLQNMIAAYHISHGGKTWQPWTTYTRGTYRSYMGQATSAAGTAGSVNTGGSASLVADVTQVGWQDAVGLGDVGASVRKIGLILLAVAAGGALVVAGGYQVAGAPPIAGKVAKLAVLA